MQPSRKINKWIPFVLLLVSLLGFADAAYLTAKHYQGETPNCILFSGCEVVTTSKYSVIAGFPIALFGALFYLSIFFLILFYIDRRKESALRYVFYGSVPAFVFTLYLIFLQLFVLNATCVYCMFSAITSTTIFVLSHPRIITSKAEAQTPS